MVNKLEILIQEALDAIVKQNTTRIDDLIKTEIPLKIENLKNIKQDNKLMVIGKTAQGGRSFVPWIVIMNTDITNNPLTNNPTVQRGYYIALLFAKDGSSVHLSLNQGVTNIDTIRKQYNKISKKNVSFESMTRNYSELLRKQLNNYSNFYTEELDLRVSKKTSTGYKYQFSNIISIRYDSGNVPNDKQIEKDINSLISHYNYLISKVPDHDQFINNNLHVVKIIEKQTKKIKSMSEFDTTIYDAEKIEALNTYSDQKKGNSSNTDQTGSNNKRNKITSDRELKESLERRQLVGDVAEEIALKFYKQKAIEKFGEGVEDKVRLITKDIDSTAKENGHGYGYDIIALDYEKQTPTEIYVEVKGTQSTSQSSPFEISDNELNKLLEHKEKIRIARVFGVGSKKPKIIEIKGFENYSSKDELMEKKFNIKPTSYRIFGVNKE